MIEQPTYPVTTTELVTYLGEYADQQALAAQNGHTIEDEGTPLTQRANLNAVGAGVQLVDDPANNATKLIVSGQLYSAVTDTPEAHGAKRDGKQIRNCAMTSGQAVLTCTDAPFVSGDVGKVVHVRGAAGSNIGLTATISAFTDSQHVTLNASASATVSAQVATYGTDDTAAWVAAIAAAVTAGQADGSNYAEIVGSNGIYMIAAATIKGGSTLGNAQIPLPVVNPTTAGTQKFVLKLGGARDSATVSHWDQTVPQKSGCVLFSTLTGQTTDGTYGVPSVLGGPTVNINASPAEVFSNMKVIVDGLSVVPPFNPSTIACDFRRVAQADVLNLACLSDATPDTDGPNPTNATRPTNTNGIGLYMPSANNNDSANIGVYHCEGFYIGVGISDHVTAQKLLIVYCDTAIYCANVTGGGVHGSWIAYASVEACNRLIDGGLGASTIFPLRIEFIDVEIISGTIHINDPNNALHGYVGFADNTRANPRLNGAKNLKVENMMVDRGAVSPQPGLPQSAGGSVNVSGATNTTTATITTATPHGLTTGQSVTLSGIAGAYTLNNTWNVTVTDSTHFTVPNSAPPGVYTSGGTVVNTYTPGRDALICIAGGTVTAVTIDGQATGLTGGTFLVPANKPIAVTYSSAPTWTVYLT